MISVGAGMEDFSPSDNLRRSPPVDAGTDCTVKICGGDFVTILDLVSIWFHDMKLVSPRCIAWMEDLAMV